MWHRRFALFMLLRLCISTWGIGLRKADGNTIRNREDAEVTEPTDNTTVGRTATNDCLMMMPSGGMYDGYVHSCMMCIGHGMMMSMHSNNIDSCDDLNALVCNAAALCPEECLIGNDCEREIVETASRYQYNTYNFNDCTYSCNQPSSFQGNGASSTTTVGQSKITSSSTAARWQTDFWTALTMSLVMVVMSLLGT